VDLVLFFLVGRRRLRHHLLGDEREHDGDDDPVAVVVLILSKIGGRFLSTFSGISLWWWTVEEWNMAQMVRR
jgi:hypothetical protein